MKFLRPFIHVPSLVKHTLANIFSFKLNRQIVVFESDDWGSLRMPSLRALEALERLGLAVEDAYNQYDSLEVPGDIYGLVEVLNKHRDGPGKPPVWTFNYSVANPDFSEIGNGDFAEYQYESSIKTYQRTPGCERSWDAISQCIDAGFLRPQLHGREHLNVDLWMSALREQHEETLHAFQWECWGHSTTYARAAKYRHFLAALDFDRKDQAQSVVRIAQDAASQFKNLFGFSSATFIAPCFTWNNDVEIALEALGVRAFQGQRGQYVPAPDRSTLQAERHFFGEKNQRNQVYLVRNAVFEPSSNPFKDWVDSCLSEIESAFRWGVPAIVSTHRVNLVGSLSPENRDRGLRLLDELLFSITKKWPGVEFMASDNLAELVLGEARDER